MDDIHARAPVDRVAARVVFSTGEHFDPNKQVLRNDSETPLRVTPVTKAMLKSGSFVNLTGLRFGRFTVLGVAKDFPGWVVRCDCGRYSTRRAKAIKNPANAQDRCDHCLHLAYLQRNEIWRRTAHRSEG